MTASVNLNRLQLNGLEDFSWELPLSSNFNMLLAGVFKWIGPLQCLNVYAAEFESFTSILYIVTTENISNLDPTLPVMLYAERISTYVLGVSTLIVGSADHPCCHPAAAHGRFCRPHKVQAI